MRRNMFGVQIGIAAIVVIMLPVFAVAQTQAPLERELMFRGGGAKAAGLGGAFIGVADDASASYWNPAGLAQNDRVYMALDWGYGGQRVRNHLDSPRDLAFLYDNSSNIGFSQFDFVSFASPIHIKGQQMYLSASWLRGSHAAYEAEENITDFSDAPTDPTGLIRFERERLSGLSSGGPSMATLAAGTWLKEEVFSAGFGINIYSGSRYDSVSLLVDVDVLLLTRPPVMLPIRVVFDSSQQRSYSGLNLTVGTMFHAENFSVGATFRTPYTMTITHDVRRAQTQFERTPDSVLVREETSSLYLTDSEFDLPLQIGIGFSYRPQSNLMLAMDYEFTGFSSAEFRIQEDVLDPRSDFIDQELTWKDVHQFRFGMEYKLDLGWGSLPLRAGFRNDPLPVSHLTDVKAALFGAVDALLTNEELVAPESTEADQIVGEVYSLGLGIEWNQVRLDVTWEYQTVSTFNHGYFEDSFLRPQFIYEQGVRNQRLLIGFTGYF